MPMEIQTVAPMAAIEQLKPGMNVYLSTGVAEPRTLVKHIMNSKAWNLLDLELSQLVSLGDAVTLKEHHSEKFRLKNFFSGWEANEAIAAGLADFIPSSYFRIPRLVESGRISIDAAFIQITPPNDAGYCSLGVSIDAARQAIEQASFVVGEINPLMPRTFGDTFVHVSDFDLFVDSTEPMIYFDRWTVDDAFERIGAHIASVIEDGSCLGFSIGPLYESLSRNLTDKKHLGIHSPFFIDALMDLVNSGAVTNRRKETYRGKCLTSYAFGTPELMKWLNNNPLVEFQGTDKVFDPVNISQNPRFVAVLPGRKAELSGRIALHIGKGNVGTGPGEVLNFFLGAMLSRGGKALFALPSRNRRGESNICVTINDYPNHFGLWESIDMIATEYGVVSLTGRSVRERAQALIDIAHPDDRPRLVEQAKEKRIIYTDQIFLPRSAHLYPSGIESHHSLKDGLEVRFRPIKPSDEEGMRKLFYRFSDEAVYYRYFTRVRAMPHARMQEYVNIDYSLTMSIVALVGEPENELIIAEGRFARESREPTAEVAFVVDEEYKNKGIASRLFNILIRLARERGIMEFTADVLSTNQKMIRVFEKGGLPVTVTMLGEVNQVRIPLGDH